MTIRIYAGSCTALLLAQAAWSQAIGTVTLPAEIAAPGVQVEVVHDGLAYSEGPTFDKAGNLYFSEDPDVQTGRIWKITPSGTKSVFKDPSRGSNGLEMDNQGRLIICMLDSVLRVESDGKVTALAAKTAGGADLRRVNDVTLNSTGAMFFSNLNGNTVFYRSADGQFQARQFQGQGPNGVEWIEEKSILYIGGSSLQKCAVNNATGEIGACTRFAGATDGLTTDVNGNVYRASWGDGKVFVHDSTGRELGSIAIHSREVTGKNFTRGNGGNTSNCAFGGPDLKTLYITGDGGCYRVQLKIPGRVRPGWATTAIRPGSGPALSGKGARMRLRSSGAMGMVVLDSRSRLSGLDGRREGAAQLPAAR